MMPYRKPPKKKSLGAAAIGSDTITYSLLELLRKTPVSPWEAMHAVGCGSLTREIARLRAAGYSIKTLFKRHPLTKQRYARYYLQKEPK